MLKKLKKSLIQINKFNNFIFDCDGVILQSNKLKTEAFKAVLSNEPKYLVKKFISYHKKNGGISRYEKISYFYKFLKNDSNSEKKIKIAIENYSKIVIDKLLNVNFVPGFLNFISFLYNNKFNCYVISGGDEKELNFIFKRRKISKYFISILGSPKNKNHHLKKLIKNRNINQNSLFFGDSFLDYDVSIKNKINFCYVSQFSEWKKSSDYLSEFKFYSIKNFNDLNY